MLIHFSDHLPISQPPTPFLLSSEVQECKLGCQLFTDFYKNMYSLVITMNKLEIFSKFISLHGISMSLPDPRTTQGEFPCGQGIQPPQVCPRLSGLLIYLFRNKMHLESLGSTMDNLQRNSLEVAHTSWGAP